MRQLQFLKSHFLTGLFVLIPFGVSAWILLSLFKRLWEIRLFLPLSWRPESFSADPLTVMLLDLVFSVVVLGVIGIGVSILGWVSKQYFGRKVLAWVGGVIQHIPVIRSIYSSLDQLFKTLASGSGQQFNRVVYIEYPRKGIWALAFVTGPAIGPAVPLGHLNVYIPTTPNPTSGFHLIVPETDVRESLLEVQDAFKTILSLGITQSTEFSLSSKG